MRGPERGDLALSLFAILMRMLINTEWNRSLQASPLFTCAPVAHDSMSTHMPYSCAKLSHDRIRTKNAMQHPINRAHLDYSKDGADGGQHGLCNDPAVPDDSRREVRPLHHRHAPRSIKHARNPSACTTYTSDCWAMSCECLRRLCVIVRSRQQFIRYMLFWGVECIPCLQPSLSP